MTISDWLLILAVLLAPVTAVQVQKLIEMGRERRERRMNIFRVLMSTRAAVVSPAHVQALNMIDIEFGERRLLRLRLHSPKDKKVLECWKAHHHNLNDTRFSERDLPGWLQKTEELLIDLIHSIAIALRYDFDKTSLKTGVYKPALYGNIELDQHIIRTSLVEIMTGKKLVPMEVTSAPLPKEMVAQQDALFQSLTECLEGRRAIMVRLEGE